MRALIISNKNPLAGNDGGSLGILNVLKGYRSVGIDITLLTMNPLKHYIPIEQVKSQIEQTGIEVIDYKIDTNINYLKLIWNLIASRLPYNLERFYDKKFRELIIKEVSNNKYDFIQLESSFVGMYVDAIREINPQIPIYLRAHNVEYEIWELNSKSAKNLAKKIYFKIIARRLKKFESMLFNNVDIVLSITELDTKLIELLSPNANVHILPFPIEVMKYPYFPINSSDANQQHQKNDNPDISFAYLGSLNWIPNQEGLTWFIDKVWKKLSEEFPMIKFYIAGKNPPDNLKNKLRSKNVIFLGEIADAKEFIASHPIFIVPLFAGSGVRVKIIEQMAMGRIIISTSLGAESIDIRNGINGFIANTPDEFINIIRRIIDNEFNLEEISKNARKYIESTFDSEQIFKEFASFLNSNNIKKNY